MPYLIDIVTKDNEDDHFLQNFPLQINIPYRLGKDLSMTCRCGFLLKTNYKLTDTYCPNPYCFEANSYKVVRIFGKAHVSLDMGPKNVERILLHNRFSRHMDIFTINDLNGFPPGNSDTVKQKWLEGLWNLRRDIALSDYIEFFQLDNIGGTKCSFIFSGMSTVDELEQALNKGGEFRLHISKVLGFASSSSNSTWNVYNSLQNYLPLFKMYAPYFTFKKVTGSTLFLALTGNFLEFRPRNRFIDWIDENYDINPILVKYSDKADFLVYEEVNHSKQFNKAKSDGRALHITDFLDKIKHLRREPDNE